MTDPNLPNDPRFDPPQPPQLPQPPQAPQAPNPPPQPPVPPVHPPQSPQWAAQPPVTPPQQPQWAAPAPPATPPPGAPADQAFIHGATVQDTVQKKPSIVGRVGIVAAALAVAGGGAFAVTRALSEPAGPASPDEAVAQLFEAIDNDDLIGLTEVMLPSEREALIEPMADLFAELERLEIIDESVDIEGDAEAGSIDLDFTVTGLEFTTTEVGAGVVNVELDAGVVSVEGEVGDLPFGAQVTDELDSEQLAEPIDEQIVDFADEDDVRFTVVEEDGSWYVSLWYSVAEAAREDAGEPAPDFGNGIAPVGGETPEDAVRIMFEAASDLDPERAMAALDPNEFRALHDYAPLFMDDVDEAVAEARGAIEEEGITWSIDRLDLSSSEVRGRTFVSLDGIAVSAASATQGESASFDYDGNCFTVVVEQTIDQFCADELRSELDGELPSAYFDLIEQQRTGVTVVQRDGQWYVSGFPTIIGVYTDLLASLERQDIDEFIDFFEDLTSDVVGLGNPFLDGVGNDTADPLFDEEPYDPFAEEEPPSEEEPFEFEELDVAPEDAALFPADWTVVADDPFFAYFAGQVGLPATSYVYGYSFGGPSIYVERIDASAEELNAGMASSSFYELVEIAGYPDGATVYDWEGVDRAVVIDGFVVSTFFDDEGIAEQLLLERVNAIVAGQ